jgi:hypothetical protein
LAGDEAPIKQGETAMTIQTNVKAGGQSFNHNETLRVQTTVKAGGQSFNHNETFRG